MSDDYYSLLGVAPDAPQERIEAAFLEFTRAHAAERNTTDAAAAHRFQKVETAYRTLSDPEMRATYDRLGGRPGAAPQLAEEPAAEAAPGGESAPQTPDEPGEKMGFEWSWERGLGVVLIVYGLAVIVQGRHRLSHEEMRHLGLLTLFVDRERLETGNGARLAGLLWLAIGIALLALPGWRSKPEE